MPPPHLNPVSAPVHKFPIRDFFSDLVLKVLETNTLPKNPPTQVLKMRVRTCLVVGLKSPNMIRSRRPNGGIPTTRRTTWQTLNIFWRVFWTAQMTENSLTRRNWGIYTFVKGIKLGGGYFGDFNSCTWSTRSIS